MEERGREKGRKAEKEGRLARKRGVERVLQITAAHCR